MGDSAQAKCLGKLGACVHIHHPRRLWLQSLGPYFLFATTIAIHTLSIPRSSFDVHLDPTRP